MNEHCMNITDTNCNDETVTYHSVPCELTVCISPCLQSIYCRWNACKASQKNRTQTQDARLRLDIRRAALGFLAVRRIKCNVASPWNPPRASGCVLIVFASRSPLTQRKTPEHKSASLDLTNVPFRHSKHGQGASTAIYLIYSVSGELV